MENVAKRRISIPATTVACVLALMAAGSVVQAFGQAWILTTDYSAFGRLRAVATSDPWTVSEDLATIPGDVAGRYNDGLLYVVGRGDANLIQIYDPGAGHALLREFGVGVGRNPQDIAFNSDGEAFVSCYDEATLLQVDTQSGVVIDSYDTSQFADADGLPETAWMQIRGDLLFITCQRLDRDNWYSPSGPGALLVFDTVAKQWVDCDSNAPGTQPLELQGANPYTRLLLTVGESGEPRIWVGCVGFYGMADGWVETVDPVGMISLGMVAAEEDLGGDLLAFVRTGQNSLHCLVADASFNTSVRHVDLNGGTVTILHQAAGYFHADLAWDGDFQLFVADRTTAASGIRVFDSQSGVQLTTGPLPTGLPPFQFVLPPEDEIAGAPGRALPLTRLQMSAPWPNPCNPGAELQITGTANTEVEVVVLDLRGRRVQRRTLLLSSSGQGIYRFDGRGDSGHALAAGVYRIVARRGDGFAARTISLIK